MQGTTDSANHLDAKRQGSGFSEVLAWPPSRVLQPAKLSREGGQDSHRINGHRTRTQTHGKNN